MSLIFCFYNVLLINVCSLAIDTNSLDLSSRQIEGAASKIRPLQLAADEDDAIQTVCHNKMSFLGVGNTDCLNGNLPIAIFLVGVIIIISIGVERLVECLRHKINCPQLRKIVNRVFEEIMMMGFISMVIFFLNTSGLMTRLDFRFDDLTATEQLHFVEFFHYVVFFTMIYSILIVLLLLFIGTVVPRVLWRIQGRDAGYNADEMRDQASATLANPFRQSFAACNPESFSVTIDSASTSYGNANPVLAVHPRAPSGFDLVGGSRAYSLLLHRYKREGWFFRFNVKKQWQLWKSLEILAYNICQNRSGYIYKNPSEMERLFEVPIRRDGHGQNNNTSERTNGMTYEHYHVLCMRNLLYNISHLHYSAFFILLVICVAPSSYPQGDKWIILGIGGLFFSLNLVIFFKVLHILRGIVDDRLRIISKQDIQKRLSTVWQSSGPPSRPSFRSVALCVRSVIRMQMSALCHRQLHCHDARFWFRSPRFLLRLFQIATIGQAFYLVWVTLVEIYPILKDPSSATFVLAVMLSFPFFALFVITPLTMPSLVLVMSLTGIFAELNLTHEGLDAKIDKKGTTETKNRIRYLRRSFLQSYHSAEEAEGFASDVLEESPNSSRRPYLPLASPNEPCTSQFASPTERTSIRSRGSSQSGSYRNEEPPANILTLQQRYGRMENLSPRSSITNSHKSQSPRDSPKRARLATLDAMSTTKEAFEDQQDILSGVRYRAASSDSCSNERTNFQGYCSKYGGYVET
ncbi:unnamed protein product [Albugo candida]|uniref:TRP C-terminal domain-containing protein n=1 Tax=Albugo candida TaxID=65357 RepID=A0A024GVY6_9STRA|nr:unnamed protein product [Albugo candida]CCI50698.1 unnamed protein product [Albugo candida]|eukprot:CCI11570.1 unnamed protein product [Albugo candida]